jgi:hypothetical protein
MLTYFFKSSYVSSWRKNMSTLKILGRTCRFRLIFTPCRSFLRIFQFFSIFVFASIKCILNSLESISIWYHMKAYSITFQLNTRYIHFVAIKFCQTWKPYPSPFLKWKKKEFFSLKTLDKKIFRTKLRSSFILSQRNISHLINQALVILYEVIFVVKLLEKWDIFNFADFHRILHIS